MYYLQSRYYSPEWGRFVNADGLVGQLGHLLSHNLFTYCMNNPANMTDESGYLPSPLGIALGIIGGIVGWGFGGYVADKLGLHGWKYWAVRSAVMLGGAALGFFAGEALAPIILTYLNQNQVVGNSLPGWIQKLLGYSPTIQRALTAGDLGLSPSVVNEISGSVNISNGICNIRVDMISANLGKAANIPRYFDNLINLARVNGASVLRIEASFANEKLMRVIGRFYRIVTIGGKDIIEISVK